MSTLSNILALLTQLSLIVTCTFLLGLLRPRLRSLNARASIVLEGGLYGLFAILVMLNPIREADGVIFDLRNVIIAVAGAFGGPVPAAIISVFVIAYRITLGGAGIATAVGSALTCVVLSVVVYSYRKRYTPKPAVWLVGLGLVAGLETIAWLLVLPAETARQVIAAIGLPILITYPISSWLFGSLLLSQAHHEELEAALTAERNMLRTLIDTIPGNVYIKDTQSRFVDANIVTLHRFGIESLDDLVGKTDDEFFTPELAGKYLADEQTVLQSGEPLLNCEELTFDQRTQQHIWFLTTKAPIRSERGEITGLVGVGLDITERKQAEQVLRANAEAEHHFQAALQALHEITIELTQIDSLDNFYRRVVELALQRLGFDRFGLLLYDAAHASVVGTYGTDAQGKVVAEHHLRIDPALLTGILKRTLDAKERLVFDENAALFSNLEPIGFGWNAVTSLWNGAQTLGWVAADNGVQHQPLSQPLLDILALYAQTVATLLGRKQAEAALRANEAKLQTFFEMLPVGISVFNADGQIVEMNPALGRILDISAERLQRNDFRIRQYIFDDGRPVADSELPNVRARVEQQAIHNVVIGVIKEDGKTVWTSISAAPLPGADAGVITVTADITERKQAEAQAFALDAERQRVKLLREFIAMSRMICEHRSRSSERAPISSTQPPSRANEPITCSALRPNWIG